jgi:hypothetical protein
MKHTVSCSVCWADIGSALGISAVGVGALHLIVAY